MANMRSKTYQLEKIIFRFIQTAPLPVTGKDRQALWLKFKQHFDTILMDKYEIQVLKIFDFAAWIESKLCRKDFAELLRAKWD
jgi:hypothetical protein